MKWVKYITRGGKLRTRLWFTIYLPLLLYVVSHKHTDIMDVAS